MVAKVTQATYGILTYATRGAYGNIVHSAYTNVASTRTISMAASILFLSPNCIGVNDRLKTMLSINGSNTENEMTSVT
jgi:hypothetical protein